MKIEAQKEIQHEKANARIIREKSPRVIMIENVKNLLGHDNGNTCKVIHESLSGYGKNLVDFVKKEDVVSVSDQSISC